MSDIIVKTLEEIKKKRKAKARRRCCSIFENEVQINTIKNQNNALEKKNKSSNCSIC